MAEVVATQTQAEGPDARALGALLAALGPLFAWIASASAYPPATAGEHLLGAGLSLLPADAPGHPIASLGVALCTRLVPLGPAALRAALATGLFAAAGAAALYRALDDTLAARAGLRAALRSPLALGCSWLAFGCAPLFGSAPETALAGVAIGCLFLQRLCAVELTWPRLALRPLREAALSWSLLFVEQPALAVILLVAALPTLVRVLRAYALPLPNLLALLFFWPLLAFGALRAGAIEATPYPGPGGFTAFGAAFALQLHLPRAIAAPRELGPSLLMALGLAGALLAWTGGARRRFAALWSAAWLAPLAASAWLAKSDALDGFALCGAAGLTALGLARLLAPPARGWLGVAVAVSGCALALAQFESAGRALRASDDGASDAIADASRRDLPARAVLLLAPDLAEAWVDGEREERLRPDVLVTEKPWRLGLEAAQRRAARKPELQPLLRADLLRTGASETANLPLVELQALAARRPLLLELEPALERDLYPVLLPFSLYHQLTTSPVGRADLQLARRDHELRWKRLYARLLLPALSDAPLRLLHERLAAERAFAAAVRDPALAASAAARAAQLP